MDFYFTDRKFNLLGVASTDGSTDISLANEEDKLSIEDSVRTLAGSLFYGPESRKQAESMSALGNYVLYKDESGRSVWTTIMEINNDPLAGECVFLAEDAGVDLINELVGPYTADKAYPIASYISRFTADSGFKIGVNEISNLSRKLEWESEESTALARILSVATQFDNAELEFRFEVNGLEVVERYIDIFKKRGKDERVTLYVDKDINRITTSGNIYDLGTSLVGIGGTPEGQDNPITLKGYKYTDKTGRYVLGSDGIMRDTVAVQKRSRLLSNDNPAPKSSHIQRRKTYETTDQKTLCDDVLRDLKKMAEVELNYEAEIVSLPYGVKIGDTIYLVDEQGELYLSARVLELVRCYSEDRYLATLGNYLIKDSGVDVNLQELADKLKDQIKPGDTYYPWTRYADDANGTGMSSVPDGKTYMATVYRKNDPIASDNPEDYAGLWVKIKGEDGEAGQTPVVHPAWSWSPDGTDRFTTVYPRENVLSNSRTMYINTNNGSSFPISSEILVENGEQFVRVRRINLELNDRTFSVFNTIPYPQLLESISNKKVEFSCMARASKEINISMMAYMLNPNKNFESHSKLEKITTEWTQISTIENLPDGLSSNTLFRFIPSNCHPSNLADFYVDYKNWKIAIVDDNGDKTTIYTPAPSEDPLNAYPLYEGTYTDYSDIASTNPSDYTWRRIKGEDGQSPYDVDIISTNGLLFKNGIIQTTLTAVVYRGEENVTEQLDANQFRWTKINADGSLDKTWNTIHAGGAKTITVTSEDIYRRATFNCDIVEI